MCRVTVHLGLSRVYRARVERSLDFAVVVLAAGAGTRYVGDPGAKLLAELDGKPILAHVLDEVRRFAPAATAVVLGHGAAEIERSLSWTGQLLVRNHAPDDGLASSLQVGIDALRALPMEFRGAFIVLGDQPLLRADVMRELAAAATSTRAGERPVVVPRYGMTEGARNPVLLMRAAWRWVDAIEGDHGLAPLIAERPEAILEVQIQGEMPDVDTRADLERLERANREERP